MCPWGVGSAPPASPEGRTLLKSATPAARSRGRGLGRGAGPRFPTARPHLPVGQMARGAELRAWGRSFGRRVNRQPFSVLLILLFEGYKKAEKEHGSAMSPVQVSTDRVTSDNGDLSSHKSGELKAPAAPRGSGEVPGARGGLSCCL